MSPSDQYQQYLVALEHYTQFLDEHPGLKRLMEERRMAEDWWEKKFGGDADVEKEKHVIENAEPEPGPHHTDADYEHLGYDPAWDWCDDGHLAQYDDDPNPYHGTYSEE